MKIGIIGTRGIPNNYGGFEQFAEFVSTILVQKGFEVFVYSSHNHVYQGSSFNGINIIHCNDPEYKLGTVGQFIYDLNCIRDARKRDFDIILQLGYTSSSVWHWLMPKKAIVTTNMDGLEWKRTKFSKPVQKFIKYAEKLAVKYSDHLIADSIGIQSYIKGSYNKESTYIPYGATPFDDPDPNCLKEYGLDQYEYNLLIARLEPENSIETILKGHVQSNSAMPIVVIGKTDTPLGQKLKEKYASNANITFLGGVYDQEKLNNLRYYSNIYFHGHTVGGTNPSLLEAMASNAFICANDNEFNKSILNKDAVYFGSIESIIPIFNLHKKDYSSFLKNNLSKIKDLYSWELIASQYEAHFLDILK